MSPPFTPARSSTPPSTLVQRSAVSDISRSSALSIADLATLTPDEVEFLDAVISRAPTSATTFIHIFKAYNEVISERGLDAENEVNYYKKLLKIGTLKGENWGSKWRAVKAQNGYSVISTPAKTRLPLHKATPQAITPSSKVASVTPAAQSSTARLLQRLKTLQRGQPTEPSEAGDLPSQTDITDTETDSPPRTTPAPAPGRPSSTFTTTNNTLGLDVGAVPGYPPSSTLAPSKPTGLRWPERDFDIDKSVPFLTSTPPLSPHKPTSRPTPASIRQPILHPVPKTSAPFRSLADMRTPNSCVVDGDEAWNRVRVEQEEQMADQFRNTRLLQRCFDVWKQGHDWVIVSLLLDLWAQLAKCKLSLLPPYVTQATTAQISHARDTFVLRVAIHKWRTALVRLRERTARADACASASRQKATLVRWHAHLQERRKAAWRADMRVRMQTVRSLRDGALRRDAWARWRQLYQSRLMQQRFAMCLVERYFERWKDGVRAMDAMKESADQLVAAREGRVVVRCWDSWVMATELRSAERDVKERVGARVVGEFMALWRRRMCVGSDLFGFGMFC